MIPFPGESVTIGDAVDLTGGGEDFTLFGMVRLRGGRAFGSGTAWRFWVFPGDATYLEGAGLGCDVSWVVEVASGTVTLNAGEMFDPTYYDYTSPTTPLGTFTVTGPATLVIPSGFTSDQLVDVNLDGGFLFEMLGASGSAVVEQVKLRVWPQGGAVGGWTAPLPSWTTEVAHADVVETGVAAFPDGGTVAGTGQESWALAASSAADNWPAAAAGPHTFYTSPTGAGYPNPDHGGGLGAYYTLDGGGEPLATSLTLSGASFILSGGWNWANTPAINPALVDGVDYIRPPTEVRDEAGMYLAQQIGTGFITWVNAVAQLTTGSEFDPVPAPTFTATAADDVTMTPTGGGTYTVGMGVVVGAPLATPGSMSSGLTAIPLPTSGTFIVVSLAHTGASAPAAWPGSIEDRAGSGVDVMFGVGTPGADWAPTGRFATLPPYRVWLPLPLPVLRQRLRDTTRAKLRPSRQRSIRQRGYL